MDKTEDYETDQDCTVKEGLAEVHQLDDLEMSFLID